MQMPLQITSRDLELTESIEQTILEKVEKLDGIYDRIIGCRVSIEVPHKHKHKGGEFNLFIDVTVPGKEIVVKNEGNENLYISIRDAFDVAARRLKEYANRRRGNIKSKQESVSVVPSETMEF